MEQNSRLHYATAVSKHSLEIVCDRLLYVTFHKFSQASNVIQKKLNRSCFLVKISIYSFIYLSRSLFTVKMIAKANKFQQNLKIKDL